MTSTVVPLRIACVGAGWVTTNRHLPALARMPGVEVVGVIDRHPERAAAAARAFKVPNTATTLEAPWLSTVDAVTIGTSPDAHYPLALAALEAGKHVLCEKPFTLNVDEAEALVVAAERHGRLLAIMHNLQFCRSMQQLQARLASDGPIIGAFVLQFSNRRRRLPSWYEQMPGGLAYDEGPHLLYLLRAIVGDDLTLRGAQVVPSPTGPTPSQVTAQFTARGGTVAASLSAHYEASISEWGLCVWTAERTYSIDLYRDILIDIPNDGAHGMLEVWRTSAMTTVGHWWGMVSSATQRLKGQLLYGTDVVMERWVHAIRTGTPALGITAADGLAVRRLQHAILTQAS